MTAREAITQSVRTGMIVWLDDPAESVLTELSICADDSAEHLQGESGRVIEFWGTDGAWDRTWRVHARCTT